MLPADPFVPSDISARGTGVGQEKRLPPGTSIAFRVWNPAWRYDVGEFRDSWSSAGIFVAHRVGMFRSLGPQRPDSRRTDRRTKTAGVRGVSTGALCVPGASLVMRYVARTLWYWRRWSPGLSCFVTDNAPCLRSRASLRSSFSLSRPVTSFRLGKERVSLKNERYNSEKACSCCPRVRNHPANINVRAPVTRFSSRRNARWYFWWIPWVNARNSLPRRRSCEQLLLSLVRIAWLPGLHAR